MTVEYGGALHASFSPNGALASITRVLQPHELGPAAFASMPAVTLKPPAYPQIIGNIGDQSSLAVSPRTLASLKSRTQNL